MDIIAQAAFDWYAATVYDDPGTIMDELCARFGFELVDSKGQHGYRSGVSFALDGIVHARMIYDGNDGAHPNLWASSSESVAVAAFIRERWPGRVPGWMEDRWTGHHVTRADVALDFTGPGTWDVLLDLARTIAGERGLRVATVGDWLTPDGPGGRTLYVGSFKSPVMVRLYEKGKQVASQVREAPEVEDLDWCRLEVQVRPQKDARKTAATADPMEFWGFAAWTAELLRRVTGRELTPTPMWTRRESDTERALAFMFDQYQRHLVTLAAEHGWDAARLGAAVIERINEPGIALRRIREGDGFDPSVPF